MSSAWIGIDPGISGAVALIHGDTVKIWDTPAIKVKVGAKERSEYDFESMADAVFAAKDYCAVRNLTPSVVLEQVGTMPTDGRVGAFSFGKGYGAWQGILCALHMTYDLVSPLKWKPFYGLLRADKREAIPVAMELFPGAADRLTRIKDHNRADAILLAHWAEAQTLGLDGRRGEW